MPPRKTVATTTKTEPKTAKTTPVSPVVVQKSEVKGSGTATKAPAAKSAPPAARTITYDLIAIRAFEIYASRGYAQGDQNADWLEAERQLRAGL